MFEEEEWEKLRANGLLVGYSRLWQAALALTWQGALALTMRQEEQE